MKLQGLFLKRISTQVKELKSTETAHGKRCWIRGIFTGVGILLLVAWQLPIGIRAMQSPDNEASDPYLSLSVSQKEVQPKDTLSYSITFGNRGPRAAENVRITLNLPLGGRAPLEFVSADPNPTRWLSSEFGSLPEFFIPSLESFEATGEGKLSLTLSVRESATAQTITTTASLEAPQREIGKRLIVSEPVSVVIVKAKDNKAIGIGEEDKTASPESGASPAGAQKQAAPIQSPLKETKPSTLGQNFLASDSIWTSGAFLVAAMLLLFGFFIGRLSKKNITLRE